MRYTKEACIRAESIITHRRQKAESEREERLEIIRVKFPELYELNRSLSVGNFGLISIIGSRMSREESQRRVAKAREEITRRRTAMKRGLAAFGYPEDYLDYHFFCNMCQDTGFRDGVRCQCYEQLLRRFTVEELNANCSIKLRDFSEFRVDVYPTDMINGRSARDRMSDIYDSCVAYAASFSEKSRSLLFFGKTGLGKTFLSACIAKKLLENGVTVFFCSFSKLLRTLEDERFGRAQGDTASAVTDSELVILDDVGSEFKTNFTEAMLYELINERINLGRPTIVSTNLTLKELGEKYDDRIISRLTGCFMPMKFEGRDVRQILRAESC